MSSRCLHGYHLHPERCRECRLLRDARAAHRCHLHGRRPIWGCAYCVAAADVQPTDEDREDPAAYLRECEDE